jgi:Sulfotransferase domain
MATVSSCILYSAKSPAVRRRSPLGMTYRARRFAVRALPPRAKRFVLTSIALGYGTLAYARDLTGRAGHFPDFLIIGAQRCGTTYLYDLLTDHPRVLKASHKEIHFFDTHFARGPRWYRGNFPASPKGENSTGPYVYGEASPTYMAYSSVPGRIRELLPHIRLIALVRNPVDRAVSHFHHFCRLGYESRSFGDAIDWEYRHLSSGGRPLFLDSPEHRSDPLYLSTGMYGQQIQLWLHAFPRDQILIIPSDDLFEREAEVLEITVRFLELPNISPKRARTPKQFSYPKISRGTRQRLVELFAPYNHELESLLGCSLHWEY